MCFQCVHNHGCGVLLFVHTHFYHVESDVDFLFILQSEPVTCAYVQCLNLTNVQMALSRIIPAPASKLYAHGPARLAQRLRDAVLALQLEPGGSSEAFHFHLPTTASHPPFAPHDHPPDVIWRGADSERTLKHLPIPTYHIRSLKRCQHVDPRGSRRSQQQRQG